MGFIEKKKVEKGFYNKIKIYSSLVNNSVFMKIIEDVNFLAIL